MELLRSPSLAVALGFGAGLVPGSPGTAGTLAALPVWWLISGLDQTVQLALIAVAFAGGVWICNRAMARLPGHDHPSIVIDELVAFLGVLAVVPGGAGWLLLSFALFRALDILKPWPIGWLDRRVKGGLGIMLDDLLAGIGTAAIVLAAHRFLGSP